MPSHVAISKAISTDVFVVFVAALFYAKKIDLENKNTCGQPERTNQLSFMRRSQPLQTLWFSASVNS